MRRLLAATMFLAIGITAAACSSSGGSSNSPTTTAASGGITVPVADGVPVAVHAGDTNDTTQYLKIDPASVKAGKVTFTFTNEGTRQHEMIVLKTDEAFDKLVIDPATNKVSEDKSVGEISETDKGKVVVKTFDLAAGNYVLVCNIEKHYGQGMRVAFTVNP